MLGEMSILVRPLLATAGQRFQSSLTRLHKLDNRFQTFPNELKIICVSFLSVLDADLHGSALNWPLWIRIRIRYADSGSSDYLIIQNFRINEFWATSFCNLIRKTFKEISDIPVGL